MLSWGRLKSPLSPGVDQAASGSDSPLQFVMYLRNFCLYTNFSPPALIPSQPSCRLHPRFIPVSCPRHSALISFLMSENYLRHLSMPLNLLTKMFLFYPIFYPIYFYNDSMLICHILYLYYMSRDIYFLLLIFLHLWQILYISTFKNYFMIYKYLNK